jgi:AcrR family transcriptional regulator
MPRAFTEGEKNLIGKQLLEQGYRLFSAYGLKKTNIEEIAKAAGISKGAFYNFYASKEELFMDVVEQAEKRVRGEVMAVIDLPGPSPRARLLAVLKKAFSLFKEIPILQFFSGSDYGLLFRSIPAGKLEEHMASDRVFIAELIARCQQAGIPIRVAPEQLGSLLYPLVLTILHEDDLIRTNFGGGLDGLLELVAACSLGEVEIQLQVPSNPAPGS